MEFRLRIRSFKKLPARKKQHLNKHLRARAMGMGDDRRQNLPTTASLFEASGLVKRSHAATVGCLHSSR